MDKLLEINNLCVKIKDRLHGDFFAVRDLSLNIDKGSALGIVGESGSGKTVTALAVMGLASKDSRISGEGINFCGRNLLELNQKDYAKIRGRDMSMIFQDPVTGLNPLMKIGRQVEESLLLHTDLTPEQIKSETINMMSYTGLKDAAKLYNAYPHQLSGGMRQRVMIAAAIIAKPKLIIADEPTTALDSTTQTQILNMFKKFKEENQTSLMFISHNFGVINYISDYIAVMYQGYVMEYGDKEHITENPLHPYTKALIKCIPTEGMKGRALFSIKNDFSSKYADNHCPFFSRCDYADKKCTESFEAKHIDGRYIRCARIGEI